jgi:riboflavin biosynthesis pyrimidine reductase
MTLPRFSVLLDRSTAPPWPLPDAIAEAYGGPLGFAPGALIANFVTTLDGVASYALPGRSGGGPISGFDAPDQFLMGLLRACADAVVTGAGTLRRARAAHVWTGAFVYPKGAEAYAALRRALGKPEHPTTVVVSGRGELDWDRAAFHTPGVPVLVVTTTAGAARLGAPPGGVTVRAAGDGAEVAAQALVDTVVEATGASLVLCEGGPTLLGALVAAGRLDELFLTLAPQIAGRDAAHLRPAFVDGHAFLPEDAFWTRLLSVRSAGEHLYLRYARR